MPADWQPLQCIKDCPIFSDWVTYYGKTYYAECDYAKSKELNKPVFNLAYCATVAMNEIWVKTGVVYSKRLKLKIWD